MVLDRSRVVLAEILRPRGNRGELAARSLTDIPGRLENIKNASVQFNNGTGREVQVDESWPHKDLWVFKFAGVDSINQAEQFTGADLWVPLEQRASLNDGEYYQSDLLGCRLISSEKAELIGVVEGWQDYGGGPLMQVSREGKEVLIPFTPAYCRQVDLAANCIVMDLPSGLLDL